MALLRSVQDSKQTSSAKWVIVIACGWTIWAWVDAGNHGFSAGSKDFAIASTAFWFMAAAVAVFRLWRGRSDG